MCSLEEYLTLSTLGEFSERMSILEAFLAQFKTRQGDEKLVCILGNLVVYYRQHQ